MTSIKYMNKVEAIQLARQVIPLNQTEKINFIVEDYRNQIKTGNEIIKPKRERPHQTEIVDNKLYAIEMKRVEEIGQL